MINCTRGRDCVFSSMLAASTSVAFSVPLENVSLWRTHHAVRTDQPGTRLAAVSDRRLQYLNARRKPVHFDRTCNPLCAINAISPTVLTTTVLPPAFGPLMTIVWWPSSISSEIGTARPSDCFSECSSKG